MVNPWNTGWVETINSAVIFLFNHRLVYFSVFLIFFYVDSNLDSTFSDADPNTSGLGLRRDGLGLSELDYIFSRQLKGLLFFIQYIDNPSDVTQHS